MSYLNDPYCPNCENEDDATVYMDYDESTGNFVCPKCNCKVHEDDPYIHTCW